MKKIGYNDNAERAIHLLEVAIKAITVLSSNDSQKENLSSEINAQTFNFKPMSKEIQQQKIAEIIDNLHYRFKQNDSKIGEIREKIIPMADALNSEKTKLWQEFHLLEDEQTSIKKLISKIEEIKSMEEKGDKY